MGSSGGLPISLVAKADVGTVLLFPERFRASVGTPTLTSLNTRWPVWSFGDAASEQISGMWSVPAYWNTMAVDLIVANLTADAGDIVWIVEFKEFATGETLNATPAALGSGATTALGQYIRQTIVMGTGIAVTPSKLQGFRLGRSGASGLDTKVGAAALVAVQIRRLT